VTVSPALVNNRRVELTPVYRGGPTMPDGTVIPLARTRTPIEVDAVFDSAEKLSSELGKVQGGRAALRDALDAAADNFQGNGAKLHQALQGLAAATGVVSDQRNQLIEVITDVDDLTTKAVHYDGTIRALVANLDDAGQLLDSQGPKLTDTLDNVDRLLGQVTDLIKDNRDATRRTFDNVKITANTLADHRRELAEALDVLPTGFQNLANAADPRARALRAHANLQDVLLPPQFMQGICQRYQVPLLCAMTTAANTTNADNVAALGRMLLGAGT
jgi:virulence factor Mce-like protein